MNSFKNGCKLLDKLGQKCVLFHAPDLHESLSVPIIHNEIQLSAVHVLCFTCKYHSFRPEDIDNDTKCWTQRFRMSTDEILIRR